MDKNNKDVKFVPLTEVKNILSKVSKNREELLYEQRIALEHARKFARLSVTKTKELIKKLMELDFIEEIHAYKIADILPTTQDEVKSIFAKERVTLNEEQIKKVLDIVGKYYIE